MRHRFASIVLPITFPPGQGVKGTLESALAILSPCATREQELLSRLDLLRLGFRLDSLSLLRLLGSCQLEWPFELWSNKARL